MLDRIVKKKINLLGDPAVGKTSLLLRFVKNVYGEEYLKTIGTNVYTKEVPVIGADVKMVIHDIMGEKKYESVQSNAFFESTGAIAVADVTRKDTLDSLIQDWLPRYRKLAAENAPIILAVNKDDLEEKEITEEQVFHNVSKYFDYTFFTSAKSGKNVETAFKELASRTVHTTSKSKGRVQDILENQSVSQPRDLLGGLFVQTSEAAEIPYEDLEKLLSEAGIDKLDLEGEIKEKEVLDFADSLIDWYEDKGSDEYSSSVEKLVEKYKQ